MNVLYATDGGPPATAAAALLGRIAAPDRMRVTAVYVDNFGNQLVADAAAARALDAAVADLSSRGFEVERLRLSGSTLRAGDAIIEELRAGDYGLVAVGAGNHTWLTQLILGGVSTTIVHEAPSPTLIVHEAPPTSHDRIRVVVGVDGSEAAERALAALLDITLPELTEVLVLGMVDVQQPLAGLVPFEPPVSERFVEDLVQAEWDAAERHIDASLDRLEAAGFPRTGTVRHGSAAVGLMEAIEERDADLAVVGARGRGRLAGMALGSVSTHVSRNARASLIARAASVPRPGGPEDGRSATADQRG
jgi:nucleotide-binding universal stress UspA family protein